MPGILPTKTHLSGNPTNAQYNAAIGQFYDYVQLMDASQIAAPATGGMAEGTIASQLAALASNPVFNGKLTTTGGPLSLPDPATASAVYLARFNPNGSSSALDIGVGTSGDTWIQARDTTYGDPGGRAYTYNLLLNPNGGNVGVGTRPQATWHSTGSTILGGEGVPWYAIGNKEISFYINEPGTLFQIDFKTSAGVQKAIYINYTTGQLTVS